MFVNRHQELAFLSSVLEQKRPTVAQLTLLYGRRRVGKTVLLRHWAESCGLPYTYWAAEKEPAPLQRSIIQRDQPLFEGDDHRVGAVVGLELADDVRDVVFHRTFAQGEPLRDLAVG